jgi:predicted Zn-dependent peptidase
MQLPNIEFSKVTLANGLDVILRRQSSLPMVAVNLWYHVGSKNEERHQRGYAHLFEHLMFEGSEHYPGDFFKHLQRLGANINGSTSSDRTNYFVDIPRAHLELAMAMESDRMAHLVSALDDSKLSVQKGVVTNEYRQNYANRPYGMVWSILSEALYPPQHPYSWLTIGSMEDLASASLADVSGFFNRFYVPANASLAIVGDIDRDEALKQVERYFGAIRGGTKAIRPWAPLPQLAESRDLILQDRVELDRLYLAWHTVPLFHEHDAPLALLGDILARGKASRLYQKLVIDRQLAQDVSAYQSGRELGGIFGIVVTLRPERSMDELRDFLEAEINDLATNGVTADELQRVVTMKTASFVFALEHAGGFGGVADRLNAYNIYRGDPSLITEDLGRFRQVSSDSVRHMAELYLLKQQRVSLAVLGRKSSVSVPLDRKVPPPSQPPVAFRAPVPDILELSNGTPVWMLPNHNWPTVAMTVAMPGGASLQPTLRAGIAQLSVGMLDEGTKTRSAAEIALAAEAIGTSLSASCGWEGAFVSLRCLRSQFQPSLDLAVDLLREPTFPEAEWKRVHAQTLASLRAERDNADSRAYRALLQALYPEDHPYRHPLDGAESIVSELSLDEAIDFHRRFLVPDRAAIIIAGDLDAQEFLALLEARLGDWQGPSVERPQIPVPSRPGSPRILVLHRPGAPQAAVRVGHVGLPRTDPDFDAAMLINQILGGQFTSRLNEKLREEKGYTYGVRSHFDGRLGAGPFSIVSSLQSDRLADALDDVHQELLEMLGSRPPSQSELDDARRALIEGQVRHFENPAALVNRYANLYVHGLPPDHYASFPDRLASIDLEQIYAAMHRQLHPDALVAVVVADATEVVEPLRRLDWAEVRVIEE